MFTIARGTRSWLTLVFLGIGLGVLIWLRRIPDATWQPWASAAGGALIYHLARFSGDKSE